MTRDYRLTSVTVEYQLDPYCSRSAWKKTGQPYRTSPWRRFTVDGVGSMETGRQKAIKALLKKYGPGQFRIRSNVWAMFLPVCFPNPRRLAQK